MSPLPPPDTTTGWPSIEIGSVRRRPAGARAVAGPHPWAPYPDVFLLRQVTRFMTLRALVILFLAAFGAAGSLLEGTFATFGFRPPGPWPFVAAGILLAANGVCAVHVKRMRAPGAAVAAGANLWAQTVFDLLILTAVVHYVGSIETGVAYAYLFHIVIACIFFSRGRSFLVTGLAALLYVSVVLAERVGYLATAGIFDDASIRTAILASPSADLFQLAWTCSVWFVVWYLASTISARVQERDAELSETNRRLIEVQREKTVHMLRTTHELKAPFAAIHANTQLLLKGHCGALTDDAREVVGKIGARSRKLAAMIHQMLQLSNLRSTTDEPAHAGPCDLAEILEWSVGQTHPIAVERGIALEALPLPATVVGVKDHLKMLFDNLLSNAIYYSHRGGTVRVTCRLDGQGGVAVAVEDGGIGILPEKLPRIFEEYYRTEEGLRHNKESTGLGLTIVRHVAETHGVTVRVESKPGEGTRFTLGFRLAEERTDVRRPAAAGGNGDGTCPTS